MRKLIAIFLLAGATLLLGDTKEEPVGLVLSAAGSKLLRADTETPLGARAGDLLFAGDGLRTETSAALASIAGSVKQRSERNKDLIILHLARANRSNRERTVQRTQGKRGSGGEHNWRERTARGSLRPGLDMRDGLSAA